MNPHAFLPFSKLYTRTFRNPQFMRLAGHTHVFVHILSYMSRMFFSYCAPCLLSGSERERYLTVVIKTKFWLTAGERSRLPPSAFEWTGREPVVLAATRFTPNVEFSYWKQVNIKTKRLKRLFYFYDLSRSMRIWRNCYHD